MKIRDLIKYLIEQDMGLDIMFPANSSLVGWMNFEGQHIQKESDFLVFDCNTETMARLRARNLELAKRLDSDREIETKREVKVKQLETQIIDKTTTIKNLKLSRAGVVNHQEGCMRRQRAEISKLLKVNAQLKEDNTQCTFIQTRWRSEVNRLKRILNIIECKAKGLEEENAVIRRTLSEKEMTIKDLKDSVILLNAAFCNQRGCIQDQNAEISKLLKLGSVAKFKDWKKEN